MPLANLSFVGYDWPFFLMIALIHFWLVGAYIIFVRQLHQKETNREPKSTLNRRTDYRWWLLIVGLLIAINLLLVICCRTNLVLTSLLLLTYGAILFFHHYLEKKNRALFWSVVPLVLALPMMAFFLSSLPLLPGWLAITVATLYGLTLLLYYQSLGFFSDHPSWWLMVLALTLFALSVEWGLALSRQ